MDSRSSLAGCTESAVFRFAWTGCFFCWLILFGRWFRDETSPPKTNHSAARCAVRPSIRRDPLFFFFFLADE